MKVKALEKYYYSRREYQPGETIEMDDREAANVDILCKLGKLERVKKEEVKKPETVVVPRREEGDYTAQSLQADEQAEDGDTSRRRYRRRDMRAEK